MRERLDTLRGEVDGLDKTIVELIAQRIKLAVPIAEAKRALGCEIYDEIRERNILMRLDMYAQSLGIESGVIVRVYERIFECMRGQQNG